MQHRRPGFDPWVGKIPCRRAWQCTLVFLPGESPWTTVHGVAESDTTEQLSTYFQFSFLELNLLEAILQTRKGNIRRGKNNVKNIAGNTENEKTISLKRN